MKKIILKGSLILLIAIFLTSCSKSEWELKLEKGIAEVGISTENLTNDDEWFLFIQENLVVIEEMQKYLADRNMPSTTEKVPKEVTRSRYYYENEVIKFLYILDDWYIFQELNNPDDVVYKFLEQYSSVEDVDYNFTNNKFIISLRFDYIAVALVYTGGLGVDINNMDNWKIDYFMYGV